MAAGDTRWSVGERRKTFPVDTWNRLIAAKDRGAVMDPVDPNLFGSDRGGGVFATLRADDVVEANGVLEVYQPLAIPPAGLSAFPTRPGLRGREPVGSGPIAIAVTATHAEGQITTCVIGGAAWCLVDVVDEAHTTAGLEAGDLEKLKSGVAGATIIWKEAGEGTKKALVMLGAAGGGEQTFDCLVVESIDAATLNPTTGVLTPTDVDVYLYGGLAAGAMTPDLETAVAAKWKWCTPVVVSAGEAVVGHVTLRGGVYWLTIVDCTEKTFELPEEE